MEIPARLLHDTCTTEISGHCRLADESLKDLLVWIDNKPGKCKRCSPRAEASSPRFSDAETFATEIPSTRWGRSSTTMLPSREPQPSFNPTDRLDGPLPLPDSRHASARVSLPYLRQAAFDPNSRSTNALSPDNGQNAEPYSPSIPGPAIIADSNIRRSGTPSTNAPDEGVIDSRMRCPIWDTETSPTSIMRCMVQAVWSPTSFRSAGR